MFPSHDRPEQQKLLQDAAFNIARLNQLDIPRTLLRQDSRGKIISELAIDRSDAAAVTTLRNNLPKNKDDPINIDIRSALMEEIARRVIKRKQDVVGSQRLVDSAALNNILSQMRENGSIKLFTSDDIRVLNQLDKVAPFISAKGEGVAGLLGAQAVSSLRGLVTGGGAILAHLR